jgi:two-component system, sensor histidine kinase
MSPQPVRILNVDDNPSSLYVKTRILRRGGYEVTEAVSGGEALEKVRSERPHLVVLDVQLPDMSGLDVCAQIKQQPGMSTLVLQTSATFIDAEHRVQSLDKGADMFLVEPISGDELLASVRALLRLQRAETELARLLAQEREARERTDRIADELRLANERLQQEIGERRQMETTLREADRRKDEFLAMLAHELRNPLAPIHNAAKLLETPAMLAQARGIIERQVAHLTRLVDDLLDVSRITRRQIRLELRPVDLQTVIDHAIEAARPLIDQRGHRLEVAVPETRLRVNGDLTRLSQIVLNLLNNSAKYMQTGGRIALTLRRDGDEAAISVRDEGMGISAELLPHVFELFTQANRTLERSEGGLGVGLTLVRELAGMHGGSVDVVSSGPGQGSEFVLHLPLLPEQEADVCTETPAAARQPPRSGLRVLIVDDSRDVADSLRMLLDMRGYVTRTAYDGPSALHAAADFHPDAVLLDIGLPGMTGHDVARALLARQAGHRVTLIATSGYGQETDRHLSAEAGFVAHLVKPIDHEKLYQLLDRTSSAPLQDSARYAVPIQSGVPDTVPLGGGRRSRNEPC